MWFEKSVAEVMKLHDSLDHIIEYIQHKFVNYLEYVYVDVRNLFYHCAPNFLKLIAGINHFGYRIKNMDKHDNKAYFQSVDKMKIVNTWYCVLK